MTTKLVVPKFQTEAEEAEWWHAHRSTLSEELERAATGGTLRTGTSRNLAEVAEARKHSSLLNLTDDDLLKVYEAARRRGITVQQYVTGVVHRALERESAA